MVERTDHTESAIKRLWKRYLLDSTGVVRADSLIKLFRSGKPFPVFSKAMYCGLSSSTRRGFTYSGCRQRSCTAKQMVWDILSKANSRCRWPNIFRAQLTVERTWTEPNQSAIISCTIRSADHGFCFGDVSIIHWMQSFYAWISAHLDFMT